MDSAVVNQSLQQLLAVGLVKQAESGRYQNAGSDEQFVSILINDDFYDYFKQIHDLSRAHMNFRKPDTEYVSVSCIPLNPEDRGRARELVDEMLIKLRLLSEKRVESTHVHTLLVHLFPLGDHLKR